ncbi:MAG: HyaD/HybD family hydrogenase maturation endopeptidase [bacterium]|nr:MAG: HyaD/HybD family hydrogenase maturation endopeptidase [bacterium]
MDQTETRGKTIVLGVGNLLLRDEGVGVHVAANLMEFPLPEGFEVIEGGTDGFKLFHLIMEADRLIVVDCVKGGGEPASIYRFDLDDYDHFPDIYKTSVHQISIDEVITLTGAFREPPRTTVIGVEPAEIEMSMDLSPAVEAKLPRIMELVLETAGLDPDRYRDRIEGPLVRPGPPQYQAPEEPEE